MKYINMDNWERRDHFLLFQSRRNPCICLTTSINVSETLKFRKEAEQGRHRLTYYLYYFIMKAANTVQEFKLRIESLRPVELERIDAAFTYIPSGYNLHINCIAQYDEHFASFVSNIQKARNTADTNPTLAPNGCQTQALIYLSCIKDIYFTSLSNPWDDPWQDSVPRIIIGKNRPFNTLNANINRSTA